MSNRSNDQGRAYEFAWMTVLERELSKKRPVTVINNSSYCANKRAWDSVNSIAQNSYILSAESAVNSLLELEPRLEENDDNLLTLEFLKDEAGTKGDVRDVRIRRANIEWEIGLSIKHNHEAVKHSRVSHKLDFGKEWFEIPCSDTYWDETKPIFNYLSDEKKKGSNWSDLPNKEINVYIPLLNAFMKEVKRANSVDSTIPRRMVEYLIGIKDYHKIVSRDSKRVTLVHTFNMHGTLNKPSKTKISAITVPLVELPTRIVALEFKPESSTTVEMYLDNGWELSFRIHNASTKVEPSLKFDVQFMGMPPTILTISCSWK